MKTWYIHNIYNPIHRWYFGKVVIIESNEPKTIGGMGVMPETTIEFHWTAKLARSIWKSISKDWPTTLMILLTAIIAISTTGMWLFPS